MRNWIIMWSYQDIFTGPQAVVKTCANYDLIQEEISSSDQPEPRLIPLLILWSEDLILPSSLQFGINHYPPASRLAFAWEDNNKQECPFESPPPTWGHDIHPLLLFQHFCHVRTQFMAPSWKKTWHPHQAPGNKPTSTLIFGLAMVLPKTVQTKFCSL